jgi:uncharacterized protein (DUF362 family)
VRVIRILILALFSLRVTWAELPPPRPDTASQKAVVWFALDSQAMGSGMTPRQPVVTRMVEGLVCAVTGKGSPDAAWCSLVKPGERVGIRVSSQPGAVGGTHPAIAKAVVEGLISAGIKAENILVWDRRREDLVAAGYDKVPGLNLRWIEQGEGYDPKIVVTASATGRLVYGDMGFKESRSSLSDIMGPTAQLSEESHVPLILTRDVDKVINIPSLCDSYFTGINGSLAGMTIGTLDNWRRFGNGRGYGDSALAEVYGNEWLGKKVVLTILDGMVIQFAGGPYPSPGNCVTYSTLFASKDPVAIDATGLRLLDEQRLVSRMPKASLEGGHVAEAESRGLGKADEKMIQLRRIGIRSPRATDSAAASDTTTKTTTQ